jgi:hypothetical protein
MAHRLAAATVVTVVTALAAGACGLHDAPATASRQNAITDGVAHKGHASVGRLSLSDKNGQTYTCTATLIGRRTVLTAAHCLADIVSSTFHVGESSYPVSRMVAHPSYSTSPMRNDIAVLILSRAVSGVTPTPISIKAPAVGQQLTLIGFGITKDGASDSGTKRIAKNVVAGVQPVRINMQGTGGSVGNICNGDSGGPTFATIDGQEVQVGVHSHGNPAACGISEWDARIDPFVGWIQRVAENDVMLPSENPPSASGPPRVEIVWPPSGAVVPMFSIVRARISGQVANVTLHVDGSAIKIKRDGPFDFDVDLAPGTHTISIIADGTGGESNAASIAINVDSALPPQTRVDEASGCSVGHAESGASGLLLALLLFGLMSVARRRTR